MAVPPSLHLPLTLEALAAGKHVLVEKPAFPTLADFRTAAAARDRAGRMVLVGENDHYKPLAVMLRRRSGGRRDRRPALRAVHHAGACGPRPRTTGATTRRSPAATRSSRKASTGCTSPRAWGRASRPRRGTGRGRRGRARTAARASMMVAFRYDTERRGHAALFARGAVALQGTAPVETLRARGHHHLRVERPVRPHPRTRPAVARGCPGSATSAAIARCIATSSAPSRNTARPR